MTIFDCFYFIGIPTLIIYHLIQRNSLWVSEIIKHIDAGQMQLYDA